DRTTGIGAADNLVFLSDSMLVIPRSTFNRESENLQLGVLDVYALTPTDNSGLDMELVATLQLPMFHSIPASRTYISPRSRIAMRCYVDPIRQLSSLQNPVLSSQPAVFELADASRILLIDFDFLAPAARNNTPSFLLVPVSSIWSAVENIPRHTDMIRAQHHQVSWEVWGVTTRWIHRFRPIGLFFNADPGKYLTSGTRVLLPQRSEQCDNIVSHICTWNCYHPLVIGALDFYPPLTQVFAQDAVQANPEADKVDRSRRMYHIGSDRFTPMASVDEWMGNAKLAVAPYVKSQLCHAQFDRKVRHADYLKVWADEEHREFDNSLVLKDVRVD
ncbi:hypothetical protein FRC07_012898, partial [Ceratobasidium sp. 392]